MARAGTASPTGPSRPGPEDDWLARWADAPEHADGGSRCVVNGHRIKRWSLTRDETSVNRGA